MAIIALEGAFGSSRLKNKLLFADSTFVWNYITPGKLHGLTKKFVEANPQTTFGINITVRQELLSMIRNALIKHQLTVELIPEWAKAFTRERRKDLGKVLLDFDGESVMRAALAGNVRPALEKAERTFPYYSISKTDETRRPQWEILFDLMERYFLDSSDALILNFAASSGFNGLVTCDRDFRTANDLKDFDIYLPAELIR